jgi:AcrR family transcriptional regulator
MSVGNTAEKRPGRKPGAAHPRRCEEILDAATDLFAELGYSDAVTQSLAERLGVGKGTLYRYFPSKRDLFLAAVDRVMTRLRVTIDRAVEGIADPLDRVSVAVRTFLAYFDEHPRSVELLIQERALFRDRTTPTYAVHREKNVGRWAELYRSLIADSRVRNIPPDRISEMIGDLLYGTIFTNYFASRKRSHEQQARDILDLVFNGILTDAERRRRRTAAAGGADPAGLGGPAGGTCGASAFQPEGSQHP